MDKLKAGITEITVDLIQKTSIDLSVNEVTFPVPGSVPVVRPLGMQGKIVTFNIILWADTYDALRAKKKALEDFIEQHQGQPVTIELASDPDYNGTYTVSLTGEVDAKNGNVAYYVLRARKVYG